MSLQQFLNPKTDITFKRIFGLQRNADITIGFLNAILELQGDDIITKVVITDPHNHPELEGKRRSVVDVRCTDKKNRQYIIEMQILDQKNFVERCQYYVAKSIADQLDEKQNFKKINPVIFIGVLEKFVVDPDAHFICHHNIRNVTTNEHVLKHMDFYFLELQKFNKTEDQLVTPIDRWAFMLKSAADLDHIPSQLQHDKPLQKALKELDRAGWTVQDLETYRLSLEVLYENENAKDAWIEAGKAEGKMEEKHAMAQVMKAKGFDEAIITEVTGLSGEDIKKLK
jgi:predicted transposase/invertase (TIGR01784 family)